MFAKNPIIQAPDEEVAAGAPPIDSMPDDHVDEGWQEPAEQEIPSEEPAETALDAVNAALDGEGGGKTSPEKGEESTPPAKEAVEALYEMPVKATGEYRRAFKALSDHARGLDAKLAEQAQEVEESRGRIGEFESILKDAGATPEVLAGHLDYIKMVSSGNLEQALAFIENERTHLARALGKPVEGVDLFAEYPDIKARVDNLEIDDDTALELMRARRMQGQQDRQRHQAEQAAQQRAQTEAYQAERSQAMTELETWMAEESKGMLPSDWTAVEDALVQYIQAPETQQILQKISPSMWLPHIKQQYGLVKKYAVAQRPAATPTPLRPRGAGGTVDKAPASALDAVDLALGYK